MATAEKPPQTQPPPGIEGKMRPKPEPVQAGYRAAGKLEGKVALITGGDSGIGRAVAVTFAKEGADVVVAFLRETQDAAETAKLVEREGRRCLTMAGDLGSPAHCKNVVARTIEEFGHLDVLVNNAAEQESHHDIREISPEQLERTFRSNFFAYFFMTQAALPHLKRGAAIVNTTSVTAYRGSPHLVDYASTKGAIVAFTRSLAGALVEKGIRVNGVAPGPIWTPLIVSSFPPDKVQKFGKDVPMGRPGEPGEVAPSYVFLASQDAAYFTGQILHPNGGEIVNA